MPSYDTSTPAATAIVGNDLFEGEVWARSPVDRMLNQFGIAGSAVILDTEVALSIDEVRVGNFTNNALLAPQKEEMKDVGGLFIPAGAQLRCIVTDAATTSVINTTVDLENV